MAVRSALHVALLVVLAYHAPGALPEHIGAFVGASQAQAASFVAARRHLGIARIGRGHLERQLRCVRGDPQKAARRDPGARRYAQQLVREGPPAPELVAEDGPDERDLAHQRDQRANGALVHAPAPGHVADELRAEPLDAAAQDARGDLSQVGDQGHEGPTPRSSVLTSSA